MNAGNPDWSSLIDFIDKNKTSQTRNLTQFSFSDLLRQVGWHEFFMNVLTKMILDGRGERGGGDKEDPQRDNVSPGVDTLYHKN